MGEKIDIEAVAKAIEADAGEALLDLRQALAEVQAGAGRVTTPAQILVRQAREKSGATPAPPVIPQPQPERRSPAEPYSTPPQPRK